VSSWLFARIITRSNKVNKTHNYITLYVISTVKILSHNDPLFCVILLISDNFSRHNIKAPWRWCRSTETCRSVCNI